jgi:hypothetical protein
MISQTLFLGFHVKFTFCNYGDGITMVKNAMNKFIGDETRTNMQGKMGVEQLLTTIMSS